MRFRHLEDMHDEDESPDLRDLRLEFGQMREELKRVVIRLEELEQAQRRVHTQRDES